MEWSQLFGFMVSPSRMGKACRLGLRSLWLHRLRSFLTALGIVFGVASVIAMLAIGEGASEEAQRQIRGMGSRNIMIDSVKPTEEEKQSGSPGRVVVKYGLDGRDVEVLESLPGVGLVVPSRVAREYVQVLGRSVDAEVVGTLPSRQYVRPVRMVRGRFLSDVDVADHAPVAVIGEGTAGALFPAADPIGRDVKVGEGRYRVVGVMEDVAGSVGGVERRHRLFTPLTTMGDRYGSVLIKRREGSVDVEEVVYHEVVVQGLEDGYMVGLADAVRKVLVMNHGLGDYRITVPVELLEQAERTKRIFHLVLGSIAAISLLVGGIGIMNIMLASVTERTREVGIRRALGAKRSDIVMQFLIEAVLLSGIGGVLGVLLGLGLPFVVTSFTEMKAVVRMWAPTMAFSISVLTGIVFGIYPALRAARMSPVEALRHE